MTAPMTVGVRRPTRRTGFRLRLALGTALAGGTLLAGAPSLAQQLPTGGNVILPVGGVIVDGAALPTTGPINPIAGASTLDIGLTAQATVINWTAFNVVGVDAATKATVNFRQDPLLATALAGAPAVAVNRVTGGTASTIANGNITTYATLGVATGKQNTSVWLLNPAGVLIGGGGAIDVGAFMGSTLDICDGGDCTDLRGVGNLAALTAGTAIQLMTATPGSTASVSVEGTGSITTTGALALVAGTVSTLADTVLTAGTAVNLVAATDVRVSTPGSPVVYQIDRGTQVAGTVINALGTASGVSVVMAATRPDGFADALLNVGGTITATGVSTGANGVVLLGGIGTAESAVAGDPTPADTSAAIITVGAGQGGLVGITSGGTLTATAQDVIINGTGAVTVGGAVSALRDYRITGRSTALGTAATTVAQDAGGVVIVRATGGAITGLGTLTLRSNRLGATGGALTLSSAGAIQFDTTTALYGGNETAAGNTDIRVLEAASTTTTGFGTIIGRSLGRIPGTAETAPLPLTLYGTTTLGTVTLDRALDLTILNAGATPGSLTATAITTGVNAVDAGSGIALADSLNLTTDASMRLGTATSLTGSVTVTARDGDITGLAVGGGFGRASLSAAVATAGAAGVLQVDDGSVGAYARRTSAGAPTGATASGLAQFAAVNAGGDVTIRAQKIDVTTVQAAAVSATPLTAGAASGTATLYAYAHDAAVGAIDLRVGSVAAGTDVASRRGLDVALTADAAGGTIAATTVGADRSVTVLAGSGANGSAAISGEVRAARSDTTGAYAVTAGAVTLGDGTPIVQSSRGAVTIRSTLTDITGLGALTLQSASDGTSGGVLTLDAARAIAFAPASNLFAGNGTATGNAEMRIGEGATATGTGLGAVRARRLAGLGGATAVTLYGPTVLGTVALDRSLDLTIANGGGGALGTLTSGAITLGVNPADNGAGVALADSLTLTTASNARIASVTSNTGSLLISATNGDITGLANSTGFDRVDLSASTATTGTPSIADGGLTVNGINGLVLLGNGTAGGDVQIDARAADITLARSDRANVGLRARAADGAVAGAAAEVLTVGTVSSGLASTLTADLGSIRVGTVTAGLVAVTGTTSGAASASAYGSVRAGSIETRVGDVTVGSQHGDITGAGTGPSYGSALLSTLDGNVAVTAGAQALGIAPVGLVDLGNVFARTTETLVGTAAAPVRGNIQVVGRVVEVTRAETARAVGGVTVAGSGGGALTLQAREGTAASDVHVTLGTGLIGTTATLTAGAGTAGTLASPNGDVRVGSLDAGRNRVVGTGTAFAGNVLIDAANSARVDGITSQTGSVQVDAAAGDVTGYLGPRANFTAARATTAAGDDLAIADGTLAITAISSRAGSGLAILGNTLAGGDVGVRARAIDASGQSAQSDRGAVRYTALSGDLALGAGVAGTDVVLDATADALGTRGAGDIAVDFITAQRNADLRADRNVAVTNDVAAGTGTTGYYHVTATGGSIVLGDDGPLVTPGDADLQSATGDVAIIARNGNITGNRGLVLRSNSGGVVDGTGDTNGTRDLLLDTGGTLSFALPEGLTVAARDTVAARLIGGSDAAPRQSLVRVRAGSGTTLTLGGVTARDLRSIDPLTAATDLPAFSGRAGADPLSHPGDIRIGRVDAAESLGIFAYESGVASSRLLQIDSAISRAGNVELFASGEIRGYQLIAPGGATPLGLYVASDVTAAGDRVDARAASVLLGDVAAGAAVGLETVTGRLRVATVTTGATGPIADSGISLVAQTDLRLTSAIAARGDVLATARMGSITGLAVPDDGSAATSFAPVTQIAASDGNLTVSALGAETGTGLVAANTLRAGSSEAATAAAPTRGNVSVVGQTIGIGTATAGVGSLTLYARPGGVAPVATGILLGTGSAGTSASVTVDAGAVSAPSQPNGSAVIGTLTGGTNVTFGGAAAIPGTVTVTTAGNIRLGSAVSGTGGVTLTARDGDVTGLDDGTGAYGRANVTAAVASTSAIADGAIGVFAGRDTVGAPTATGTNGLARLGILTTGGTITVLAQAIDATRAETSNGGIGMTAYAADGFVPGGADEALVLNTGLSGLGTTLTAPVGSVRVGSIDSGRLTGSTGTVAIDAARNARIGTVTANTGNVVVTARDGDVTGLLAGGVFGRAALTTSAASGTIDILAGRDAAGGSTATGINGSARLDTMTAGGTITVRANAIDALRAESTNGTIGLTAYAADGFAPGGVGEALVLGTGLSGLGTTLTAPVGSVRVGTIGSGRLAGSTGTLVIDAARDARIGDATASTGNLTVTARDGDVTGLLAGAVYGRANLTASATGADTAVYAGRDAGGAQTATGTRGLARLGSVTAGNAVTLSAQAIDAMRVEATRGAVGARAYADDGAVTGAASEALTIGDAFSGLATRLIADVGGVRADAVDAGLAGVGDVTIDAARNVRVGTAQSRTGAVAITARDGDVTGLLAGGVFGRASLTASAATGTIDVLAGRDAAGAQTSTGINGSARLDTLTAGGAITVGANAIDGLRAESTNDTIGMTAYAADGFAPGGAGEALVLGTGLSGLGTTLTAPIGSVRVGTIGSGTLAGGTGTAVIDAARNVRIGSVTANTGNVSVTARDGDVTGLLAGAVYGRAVLTASTGAIGVYAGRDTAGAQTASGTNGLARLDAITAAGTITVAAQAIDTLRAESINGAIGLTAYADDGFVPGGAGEALVLGTGLSAFGTTLTATVGSVRTDTLDAGRLSGNAVIDAARDVRVGSALSRTGNVTVTARDGDVTAPRDGTGDFARATLTAAATEGTVAVYAGRDTADIRTATGTNGLARLGGVTAGNAVTLVAEAIDATRVEATNGALSARAYAGDAAVSGSAGEALVIGDALSGSTTTLTADTGSVRVNAIDAGRLRNGTAGNVGIDAGSNVRLATATSRTGSIAVTARGDVTGLSDGAGGFGRAALTAASASPAVGVTPAIVDGAISVFAGRTAGGAPTAGATNGLARLGAVAAGGDITILAQAIDTTRADTTSGAIAARAFAPDGVVAGSAAEALVLVGSASGLGTSLTATTGSVRAETASAGRLINGSIGALAIDAARDVRIGTGTSTTGGVSVIARDGAVTGLIDGTGAFGRADLSAAVATPATGSSAAIADGGVGVFAGRTTAGVLTATGANGLARLGTVTAGGVVTILAQALDGTRVQSINNAIAARAYAADGAVTGASTESLVVTSSIAALDTTLTSAGSVRADTAAAGQRLGIVGALTIDAAASVRIGTGTSTTGSISVTARDGDVTGLPTAPGVYGRSLLTAATATPASPGNPAIVDGGIAVFAGRDASGALTATGTNGLARLDTLVAGGTITVGAQAIDTLSAISTNGGIGMTAYAPDGFVPGGAGEALVLGEALSGLTTTLTATMGSVRVPTIDAGRLAGGIGNAVIEAAGDVRVGTILSRTGNLTVTARDGDITGLIDGAGAYGRAQLTALTATGNAAVYAGRDIAGAQTATGARGLARIGTIVAGNIVTIQAQAIDATRAEATNGAIAARAYAADGAVTGAASDALVLVDAASGLGTTLSTAGGSVRATTIDAGRLRTGAIGSATVDAARNARVGTIVSTTGNVSVAARDGDVTGLADGAGGFGRAIVTAAIGSTAQGSSAAIADGNVGVFAGRTVAGALTATGANGTALLGVVTAGNDVTVLAQKIDALTVQAAAVSATPLAAGAASGSATLHAYAHDTTTGAIDLRVGSVASGTGGGPRRGLDILLTADALGGTLAATTLNADRTIAALAGPGTAGGAGIATVTNEVRAGRTDAAGAYLVTGGDVALGTANAAVTQSARGAITVRSTLADIVGVGAGTDTAGLTLRANSDGVGAEALTLDAGRGILFTPVSRVLVGDFDDLGASTGRSDLLVREGAGATANTFGLVRARSLGGIPVAGASPPVAATLYGATTFGTVVLDRSLTLSVFDGGAGTLGTLTMGPLTIGANPLAGTTDNLAITAAGAARFATVTNNTGAIAIEVTGAGQSLVATDAITAADAITLKAAADVATTSVFSNTGAVRIESVGGNASGQIVTARDGSVTVLAGGRATYETLAARSSVAVTAGTIGVGTANAGTSIAMRATGTDAATANGEALVLDTGLAGTTIGLTATTGSVRATLLDAGQTVGGAPGDITIDAARNVRVGTAQARTGSLLITARDGDLTGRPVDGVFGRANLSAGLDTSVYAGRGVTGVLTATGANGLARIDTATGGRNVTILAQAVDVTRADATGGALLARAYAADGATPGGAGEALVLIDSTSGNATTLSSATGSVRASTIDAGRVRNGTLGSVTIDTARSIRLGTAQSRTGSLTLTARDGDVTGLPAGAATFGRATLTAATASAAAGGNAAIADGNIGVYTGRSATGALTATGSNGLAQLATATAGNDVTVLAQKIDATTIQAAATPQIAGAASGTATLRAYAHDATTGAVDLRVGTASAGTGATTRQGRDVLLTADAAGGTIAAGTLSADRNVAIAANGSAAITGAVQAGRVDPTGAYAVTAGAVTLGAAGATVGQGAAAATTVTATAGGVSGLGTLTLQSNRDGIGSEALQVAATGGNIVFDPASTLAGGTAATGSNVTLTATGAGPASIDVGTIVASGRAIAATADGAITTRGPATAATIALQGGGAVTTGGGALTATGVTLRSGSAVTTNGAINAMTVALRATGRATIAAPVTATTVTVQSSQIALNARVQATNVGLYNQATTANRTRLGGAATDDTGFSLSKAEFDQIIAPTLLIGSGVDDTSGQIVPAGALRQDVDIGALAIGADTGRSAIKVLGTGDNTITVNGAVALAGDTTRTLQLGGAATGTTAEIARIRIVNDGAGATNAGSIAAGGAILDLRAASILAGRTAFIADVAAAGAETASRLISNPNSSLYGAGENSYLTPVTLITTGRLRVQFSNVALFQNTARPGVIPAGVIITGAPSTATDQQPLQLRSSTGAQANGFALFGTFEPAGTGQVFFSSQAALLGGAFISNGASNVGGVNPNSARVNGCLIASAGGGCLATSLAQPVLNVFDVTRDQVLRGGDDLTVTFDPLIGSNNEALFGDIAAGDAQDDQGQCPPGTVSAQCRPTGDRP